MEINFFNHTTKFFKFDIVVSAATAVSYDSTEIYRDDDEEEEEGAKKCFKLAKNLVC